MKILVVSSRVPFPLKDGGAIAAYNHLRGFADAGAEISLFSLNTEKHFVTDDLLAKHFSFLKLAETYVINTRIKAKDAFLNLFSSHSYNIERFFSRDIAVALQRHLETHTYDVIQFEGLYASPYLDIARKTTGIPMVLRQHNVEYQIWQRLAETEKNPLKRTYLSLLAKRLKRYEETVIPLFDAVVAITENDRDVFAKLTDKPVISSPAGISVGGAVPSAPTAVVYHIGSMEWMPNCEAVEWFMQSVWPRVIQKYPDAHFAMAGKHMPVKFFAWQSHNITVAGEVESAEAFISDKGIMAVPLRSGSGIRMKTLEAMAAGKAVVSTSVGMQGIGATNGTEVFIADTAEAFAEALVNLICDQRQRETLGANARQFVLQHYDNRKLIAELLSFYHTLAL